MTELQGLLKQINDSLESTSESIEKLQDTYRNIGASDGDSSNVKNRLQATVLKSNAKDENVSLLSLKNGSMLAYISSLMMIVGDKLNPHTKDSTNLQAREKAIEHRVVLERGVNPLEKKLSYQLDKLTRAYTRMEKEYVDAEKRAIERSTVEGRGGDDDDGDENGDDSSDEELSYRPNTNGMVKSTKSSSSNKDESTGEHEEDKEDEESRGGIYKPPKISAMLPPQLTHFDDKFNAQEHKDRSNRSRMQAMEEYIKESSDQPDWESSIGANIVNHGRGGIKSLRDSEKERRATEYEEDNFTRLNYGTNKIEKKKQKLRERNAKVNMIGGEDFSIFNSKRKMEDSTSRRDTKKTRSAWERAKRRL